MPANVKERSRRVGEELKKVGVPSVIYDRLEVNRNGVTSMRASEATTIKGDAVYISNSIFLNPVEAAGHEAFHFWAKDENRAAFKEVLLYNIDFSSTKFNEFVNELEDGYFNDEVEIDSKNQEKLMEEVFAYISGFIHSGNNLDLIQPFLRDYNEVKSAWEELVKQHSTNNTDGSSSSVSHDIGAGFSDAQNSILSPERMAEFERASDRSAPTPEYEYADDEESAAVEEVRQEKLTQRQQEQKAALAALTDERWVTDAVDEDHKTVNRRKIPSHIPKLPHTLVVKRRRTAHRVPLTY